MRTQSKKPSPKQRPGPSKLERELADARAANKRLRLRGRLTRQRQHNRSLTDEFGRLLVRTAEMVKTR